MMLFRRKTFSLMGLMRNDSGVLFWMACFSLFFSAYLVWGSPEVMRGIDYGNVHHAYRGYFRQSILDGEFPFWNPYTFLGRPFMADPETAVWYPATWLYLVFSDSVAYCLGLSVHVFLGMAGMFLVARRWNCSVILSVFAGLVFVVSPPYAGHLQGGLIGYVHTLSWWPLGLLFVDRLCFLPSLRDWLILSMVFAFAFLAGHSHAFWLIGCSLGFYAVGHSITLDPLQFGKRVLRSGGLVLSSLLAGVCLSAVQLLPMLELIEQGNRTGSKAFAAFGSQTWEGLSSVFSIVKGEDSIWWSGNLYVGLPVLLVAVFTLLTRSDPRIRGLIIMGGVSLLLSLGPLTPVFDWLYPLIPGFGGFRYVVRFGMFGDFALILLSVVFWNRSDAAKPFSSAFCGTVVGLFSVVWLPLHLLLRYSLSPVLLMGWPLFACSLYLLLRRQPCVAAWVRMRAYEFAVGCFLVVWLIDFLPVAVVLDKDFKGYSDVARNFEEFYSFPKSTMEELNDPTRVEPLRVLVPIEVLYANSGMLNGFSMVTGNTALVVSRVWESLHRSLQLEPHPFNNNYLSRGVFESGPFPYKGVGIDLGWSSQDQVMVLLPEGDRDPRVWLSGKVFPVDNWVVGMQEYLPAHDPYGSVMVETPFLPLISGVSEYAGGEARFTTYSRNQVELEVESSGSAILVLSDAWFPGWKGEIDGVDAEVFPVNIWMRGVVVPEGSHKVRFFYRSTFFTLGVIVTVLSLMIWMYEIVKSTRLSRC